MRGEAACAMQANHRLANLEMRDSFADSFDHARKLRARHKGQRRLELVFVLHDQRVRKIQAGSLDRHAHFASLGLRRGQFFPLERIDAGGVVAEPSFHDESPLFRRPSS